LDATTGKVLWRTSDPELLAAIGPHRFAQNPREGFSSSAFVKANDQALYFAGPTRTDLVAVSATDGKLLWRRPEEGNSQLVLRDDGLFAMGPRESARYDYLTGEVLARLGPRVNCTRATASVDSIFVRGGRDGTMRYDLVNGQQQNLCPMRPSCQDGVLVAHGHLFWGPWMCDCNLTLVGVVSLASAGDFDFVGQNPDDRRLEVASTSTLTTPMEIDAADWPTLRANNSRTAFVTTSIPGTAELAWTFQPRAAVSATGPTAAGDMIFVGSQDGAVRALDANTGNLRWTAYTGGPIYYPPTLWQGRAFVGSGDGWVYCLDASSGRRLWRFRAAPAERVIPVYGSLMSTWPAASGVLVEDGVAYAAAGIANHDGTHVFALDAETGRLRWHNHSSGSLDPRTGSGVSVNGHLLRHGAYLYLAGGNMAPVARYALADGKCTTAPQAPNSHTQFTAGSDLFLVGDNVLAGGPPLHSGHGDYRFVNRAVFQTTAGNLVLAYGPHDSRVALFQGNDVLRADARRQAAAKPTWQSRPLNRICGIAMTAKAVALVGLKDPSQVGDPRTSHLVVLSTDDGASMWSHSLPAPPVPWGLLVNRDGRVVVSLTDGRVACFASPGR
jgi:outer membrane protein assembly factor BamB